MKKVLIIGATSGIAKALARQLADQGHTLFLAGRDGHDLEHMAADLIVRTGSTVLTGHFNADDPATHQPLFADCLARLGGLNMAIICLGYLGDQHSGEADFDEAALIINRNFTAVISLLTPIANHFEEKKNGHIIVLTSVAGDRGRQSNYLYGAAKGGVIVYLQGLRNRLAKSNVHVLTVKPGFVDTAMTYGLKGMSLVADPAQVAKAILRATADKKDVLYTPWFWRWIMLCIKFIPEKIFKRLSL